MASEERGVDEIRLRKGQSLFVACDANMEPMQFWRNGIVKPQRRLRHLLEELRRTALRVRETRTWERCWMIT